jgi:cytochrome c biogenesis protein CcdA
MVDIRIPIGLMFSIIGVLITGYGFFTVSNVELYKKSLGINVNIIMGIFMLLFGLIMLYFAFRKKKKKS